MEGRSEDRSQLDPVFYSLPTTPWSVVGREVYRDLARLHVAIGLALAELDQLQLGDDAPSEPAIAASALPSPAELALQMHEVAGHLLALSAGDEQDLRQIISTLRTALAVCWDLYSVRESERVTVFEHMGNLRTRIEDFERELVALRRLKSEGGASLS